MKCPDGKVIFVCLIYLGTVGIGLSTSFHFE